MNNQDILFAGLMGSKAVETLRNLDLVQNNLQKHVLPLLPFLPFRNITTIQNIATENKSVQWKNERQLQKTTIWESDTKLSQEQQFFPLYFSFGDSSTKWRFPFEPLINITGGNNIVTRNVAKQSPQNGEVISGTIKERWSQKDYDITITGFLVGKNLRGTPDECYPKDDLTKLLKFLTNAGNIKVFCHPFEILGINRIVIQDFSFPFTKGENVQAYEIKALSDFNYNLLIAIETPKPENKGTYDFLEENLFKYK